MQIQTVDNNFPIDKIRNIGFIAHIDAGKTTVTERTLYLTGRIRKVGGVDEGTTAMDWMPQEKERGITITSAATTTYWNDNRINIIDTPGHVDFTAEVERSLRVLDGGIIVLDAVAGVQPQSETVWRQADTYHVPRLAFVNKMDRVGASYDRAMDTMKSRLKANPVPIQLPMGSEDKFQGIIDLIEGQAYTYTTPTTIGNDSGFDHPEIGPVPDNYADEYEQYRQTMIEKIVETDESLMIRYLEGEEIEASDLKSALREATIQQQVVPVLCGTALRGKGIQPLLDAVLAYLPSPLDVPPVEGTDPKTEEIELRYPDEEQPLSALAFKVMTDPFVGRVVFIRVYSGKVKAGQSVTNVSKGKRERMGRLLHMHANHREELEDVSAGNICAAVGLKDTFTGDSICTEEQPLILEPPQFPQPVISVAIEPATRADQDKLSDALRKLSDEDPTFLVNFNEETGQTVMSGMGELHLEILVDRMRREFNVDAQVGNPKVSYRETLTQPIRVEGRFVRQSGGHGQFGHVWLEIEPQEQGAGITFENKITGGAIPREYINPVESGVRQALDNGPLSGYPLVDLKITLVDGSFHPVDSSEMAFRNAGMLAIREGAPKGKPVLMEPIAEMEVVTPGEFLSDILGDFGTRRAQIRSIEAQDDLQTVKVTIPLGETFSYTTSLRSLSSGRANYTMQFKDYQPVPAGALKDVVGR